MPQAIAGRIIGGATGAAARKMAEIVWALLSEKQDFDSKKRMGKYKPMNLADQAFAANN